MNDSNRKDDLITFEELGIDYLFVDEAHFYGHLEIECMGDLGLCSIEYKEDVDNRKNEIIDFCNKI